MISIPEVCHLFVHDYLIESMAGGSDVRRSPFGNTLLTAPSRPPRNTKAIDAAGLPRLKTTKNRSCYHKLYYPYLFSSNRHQAKEDCFGML